MKHINKIPFDVYAPGSKEAPPKFLETIEVDVDNRFGEEFLTLDSRAQIEQIRSNYLHSIATDGTAYQLKLKP